MMTGIYDSPVDPRNGRYAKLSVPLTTSTNGDDESEKREARASPKWTGDTPEAFIRSTWSAHIQVLKKPMVPKLIPPTQTNYSSSIQPPDAAALTRITPRRLHCH